MALRSSYTKQTNKQTVNSLSRLAINTFRDTICWILLSAISQRRILFRVYNHKNWYIIVRWRCCKYWAFCLFIYLFIWRRL